MTFSVPFASQAGRRETVLVTGAPGVVGTALLPQLCRHRLVAPARRRIGPVGSARDAGATLHVLPSAFVWRPAVVSR